MLNSALRLLDGDVIVRMGFFINDLHRHIEQLHKQQFGTNHGGEIFTCYRGQGLSERDFDEMVKSKGGLMSFNNFLSTSKERDVSLFFPKSNLGNPNLIAILFAIKIDPRQSTVSFASIRGISAIPEENEILFSMHSVFRIDDIKVISENERLFEVNLTLTSDNDEPLNKLTEQIRKESCPEADEWDRLSSVLIKLKQNNKATEIHEMLLQRSMKNSEKALIYNRLSLIKSNLGKYKEAIRYSKKALEIQQPSLPANHSHLASSYNNIGLAYYLMADYSEALSYYEKAIKIKEQLPSENHSSLATSYNNIGLVCYKMADYRKALEYYGKALEIQQQHLPNHPHLASTYNSIGLVYWGMGDYPNALEYYRKALLIGKESLPSNHPDLAMYYNNIGSVYYNMGDYSKALEYNQKALIIRQQSLPPNHPDLAMSYNNIGVMYKNMNGYSEALLYYK
ncbi:unnamed protein product [Adineta ricciae]|uniref:ADP ribosyltransferase domain-containing protein n=1 Tax=Adineta ricciae TaxID=249248 RepID=A0A815WBF8_ADIRI|nr:unnamed protein product [Adineta ricciae]